MSISFHIGHNRHEPWSAMKAAILLLLCLLIGAGCASVRKGKAVSLRIPYFEYIDFAKGLSLSDACIVASHYSMLVADGGAAGDPEDHGEFWEFELTSSRTGDNYGRLLLAKKGRKVLLEAPDGGFKDKTKQYLQRHHIEYE